MKIDIEGAEWALLADPRFRELRAPVVGLEYHAQGGAPADPAPPRARRSRTRATT